MTEIKKVMEKDDAGISRQIMPETIPEAIIGLEKYLGIDDDEHRVLSVNGQTGKVKLTKDDLGIREASDREAGLLSPDQFKKITEIITWYEEIGKSLGQNEEGVAD